MDNGHFTKKHQISTSLPVHVDTTTSHLEISPTHTEVMIFHSNLHTSPIDFKKILLGLPPINDIQKLNVRRANHVLPTLTPSTSDISQINIESTHDAALNRLGYDADVYNGYGNELDTPTIPTINSCDIVRDFNTLHLEDLNCFIDTLINKSTTPMKQFTNTDLKQHINQHWRLKIKIQMDSGASDCITPDKNLINQFRYVKPRGINTADATSTGCRIEGEGLMDIQTAAGDWLTVKMLYVPNASGTIISPTFIAANDPHFTSWTQISHTDTGQSQIMFFNRHEYCPHVIMNNQMNNCWYLNQSYLDTIYRVRGRSNKVMDSHLHTTTINNLTKPAEYELWHQRLLHPGNTCMDHIHKCVDGIRQLKRHHFHTCPICQE